MENFKIWLEKARVDDIKYDKGKEVLILIAMISFAIIQCILNILACINYVVEGYISDDKTLYTIRVIDLCIAIFFTFEMGVNFYIHPKPKYIFFFNVDTWIDFATVFPEYISWIFASNGGFDVSFLRILRVFKIIRILKFQKTLRKINVGKKDDGQTNHTEPTSDFSRLKKQLMLLVVSLFATFFIAAGIVIFLQEIDKDAFPEVMKFDGSLYFVLVTVTSIGYGDIYPKSAITRIAIGIMILCAFTVFGNQISKIVAIMKESDEFDIHYSMSKHVIVFSANSMHLLTNFLIDFYEKYPKTKVLVIGDREMGQKIKILLGMSFFEARLYFLSIGKGIDLKTINKS